MNTTIQIVLRSEHDGTEESKRAAAEDILNKSYVACDPAELKVTDTHVEGFIPLDEDMLASILLGPAGGPMPLSDLASDGSKTD